MEQGSFGDSAPHFRTWRRQLFWRVALVIATGLFSWLAMMIVHEFGHVLHAWMSGGHITQVVLHPLAISRTDVDPNPRPHFVVWGGPVYGSLLPVALWLVWTWRGWQFAYVARFFAGFCLIANGAYIGCGVVFPVGDADTMLQLGTPRWVMGAFGFAGIAAGLRLWHGLGPRFGFGRNNTNVDPAVSVMLAAAILVVATVECALSK